MNEGPAILENGLKRLVLGGGSGGGYGDGSEFQEAVFCRLAKGNGFGWINGEVNFKSEIGHKMGVMSQWNVVGWGRIEKVR
jgi:hypothetical protein